MLHNIGDLLHFVTSLPQNFDNGFPSDDLLDFFQYFVAIPPSAHGDHELCQGMG